MTTPDPMQALREAVDKVTDEDGGVLYKAAMLSPRPFKGWEAWRRVAALVHAARQAVQERQP